MNEIIGKNLIIAARFGRFLRALDCVKTVAVVLFGMAMLRSILCVVKN